MKNVSGLRRWHENHLEEQPIRCTSLADRSVNIYTGAHTHTRVNTNVKYARVRNGFMRSAESLNASDMCYSRLCAHWVISQFGNTYSCHMCTKTLLRFWLMKKSAPFAAFLRALSSFTVPHAETLRQNEGQVTADSSISHDALLFPLSRCQNLVFPPYKIYLINVDQCTSCKLLSLFFPFCSAFLRRSSCICF